MLPKDMIGMGCWGPLLCVSLRSPCPAGPQPRCRHLPPLPHQQGAGAEGSAAGAAGAGVGVWRPRAGPRLRACLPGHPPGLCAHCPRAGPSPATAAAAPAAGVSTNGRLSCSHPRPSPGYSVCSLRFRTRTPPSNPRIFLLSPLQPPSSSPDGGGGLSFQGRDQEDRGKRSDLQQEPKVCLPSGVGRGA